MKEYRMSDKKLIVVDDGQFRWPSTRNEIRRNPDCPMIPKRYGVLRPGSDECLAICRRLLANGADMIDLREVKND